MNCQDLDFSTAKATERFNKAQCVLGKRVLTKILLLALYILGAKRSAVARLLEIPDESAKTSLRVLFKDGVSAFSDRRRASSQRITEVSLDNAKASVRCEENEVVIDLGSSSRLLKIPASHKTHLRTVLLSFVGNGLLSASECAPIMNITIAHCRELAGKLGKDDVDMVLYQSHK